MCCAALLLMVFEICVEGTIIVIKYLFLQINEHQVWCSKNPSPKPQFLLLRSFGVTLLSPNEGIVHINVNRTKKKMFRLQQLVPRSHGSSARMWGKKGPQS